MEKDDLHLDPNLMIGEEGEDSISGTQQDDRIYGRRDDDILSANEGEDRVEGEQGDDDIDGGEGNDLLVGDSAGSEWQLVDGKWTYNATVAAENASKGESNDDGSDDTIFGGQGEDIVLGNAGQDQLYAGDGNDITNAGDGDDRVFDSGGDDILNLENGNDIGIGGLGADTINAGSGDDLVYGDFQDQNMLNNDFVGSNPTSFSQYSAQSAWSSLSEDEGLGMSQSVSLNEGETFELSFELAANLAGGSTSGAIEVLYDGEVIKTIETSSGLFETHTVEIDGNGSAADLVFREVLPEGTNEGPVINTDGPIFSYEKQMTIGGEDATVAAFAPGQAKLYQVVSGDLKVFDPATNEYHDAGASTGFNVNAIGFNVQDDLIYGIAKGNGFDALGNPVAVKDLVMMDADGKTYRVGETPVGDYVGDFDDDGNLWTFQSSVNRITKIDVDNLDANGNPIAENFTLPNDFMDGRMYDIAFSAKDNAFYGVEPPSGDNQAGVLHKIDIEGWDGTGTPEITSIPIGHTMFDGAMAEGMAKGAYGAVFLDGDGNLYAGLNNGNHDLGTMGESSNSGAIYKINADFDGGAAFAEYVAASERTGSNDGAVDPRSMDSFAEVDTTSSVLLRSPVLHTNEGGNDDLRGGDGQDTMYGGQGADVLHGGSGDDSLHGDTGDDKVMGGEGQDSLYGDSGNDFLIGGGTQGDLMDGGSGDDSLKGTSGQDTATGGSGNDHVWAGDGDDLIDGGSGADKLMGESGDDTVSGGDGADTILGGTGDDVMDGGAENDFILAGTGNDIIRGGDGVDKLVGGAGSDTISGGAGDDNMWGGNWWKDNSSDTFVYSKGGGKDMIHDFESSHDKIDLSDYGLTYEDIANRLNDKGWATEINLSGLDGSGGDDKIILKSVKIDDLNEDNFIT